VMEPHLHKFIYPISRNKKRHVVQLLCQWFFVWWLTMDVFFVRKSFIFDNLLFYSALLFEFVSRACRFNLSSAKDAHLLFRVIKVLRFGWKYSLLKHWMLFAWKFTIFSQWRKYFLNIMKREFSYLKAVM